MREGAKKAMEDIVTRLCSALERQEELLEKLARLDERTSLTLDLVRVIKKSHVIIQELEDWAGSE